MSADELLPEIEPIENAAAVVSMDRRPLAERSKLSDGGLVDFRRVCDQMGILNHATDTLRDAPSGSVNS
jgi:hypothetical protein